MSKAKATGKYVFSVNSIGDLRKAISDLRDRGVKLATKLPSAQGRPPLRKLATELAARDDVIVKWSDYFPESLLTTKPVIVVPPDQVTYAVTAKVRNKLNRWNAPVTVRITLAEVRSIIGASARGKVSNGKIVAAVCHKQSKAGKLNWTPSGIELVGDIVRETPDTESKPAPVVEKTVTPVADKPVKPRASKSKGKTPAKPSEPVSANVDTSNGDPLDSLTHPADSGSLVPA